MANGTFKQLFAAQAAKQKEEAVVTAEQNAQADFPASNSVAAEVLNKTTDITPVTPVTGVTPLTPVTLDTPATGDTPVTGDTPTTEITPHTGVTIVTPLTPVTRDREVKPTTRKSDPSPKTRYQKLANSIPQQAIPAGVFKSGKCKELYDVLYDRTLGAVEPKRSVRISKPQLQKLSNIGSPQTLKSNLLNLQVCRLINIIESEGGVHEGHEYEVFTWDELTGVTPLTPVRNLPPLPSLESNPRYPGLSVAGIDSSDDSKTLKKDLKIDDDFYACAIAFFQKFNDASVSLTGKGSSRFDVTKWESLAELLVLELATAAARTKSISSVPAFLTGVLRRKILAPEQKQKETGNRKRGFKPDTVGKYIPEFDAKGEEVRQPMSEDERKGALEQIRDWYGRTEPYIGMTLADFESWYLAEDWKWLMAELEKEGEGN